MSGFHLPGLFGRGDEVAADLAALVELLPAAATELIPVGRVDVLAFVLEHGDLNAEQRWRLKAVVRGAAP